jgi:hypothetical protein
MRLAAFLIERKIITTCEFYLVQIRLTACAMLTMLKRMDMNAMDSCPRRNDDRKGIQISG